MPLRPGETEDPPPLGASPPQGEATILFVRVEELDVLWGAWGDRLRAPLNLYEDHVRGILSQFEGYEIKREDTTYVYAFQDAANALRAALSLRAAIGSMSGGAEQGDGPSMFHVGMGMHVGPLVARADPVTGRLDYLGTTMNLAARLAAATQGGQTLLTRALLNAAEDLGFPVDDPGREDAWIGYRGVHHFRGLNAAVEILELMPSSQARGDLRPLRTTQVVNQPPSTVRLPGLSSPLFGREDALTAVTSALQAGERVITLLGPAGIGKSRLSAELALWCEAGLGDLSFPDGVCWVSLRDARNPEQVATITAAALGLPLPDDSPVNQLARLLSSRGAMLLILDQVDLVASNVGSVVRELRDRAGELRVILTSRVAPQGLSCRTLRLPPLRLPREDEGEQALPRNPCVLLLLDRLRERFGRVVRRADQNLLETLAGVGARVEGLPLAMHACAVSGEGDTLEAWQEGMRTWLRSQAVHLGPSEEISEQLRRAILRSWPALPTWAQAAFAQISVFRGTFSASDAEKVVDLEPWPEAPDTLAALGVLLDHGLIARQGGIEGEIDELRFRVPATLLALGVERLGQNRAIARPDGTSWSGPATRAAAERRHGEHYRTLGSPACIAALDGEHGAAALARLCTSQDNVVATIRRAARRGDQPTLVSSLRALAALAERRGPAALLAGATALTANLGDVPPVELAELHAVLAVTHLTLGQPEEAHRHVAEATSRVSRDDSPGLRSRLILLTHRVGAELGKDSDPWPTLDRALERVRRTEDPRQITWFLLARASFALRLGAIPPDAELAEALALARGSGDLKSQVEALIASAEGLTRRGDLEAAWGRLRVARNRAAPLGPCRTALRAGLALGEAASALGLDHEASALLLETLPALVAMDDPMAVARMRELDRAPARAPADLVRP